MPHVVDPTIKTRLLLRPATSSLGTIRLAGLNQGGFGIGRLPDSPRTVGYYGFTYIVSGTGCYTDAAHDEVPVAGGDLIIFFPGHPHRCHTAPDAYWDELWFECEGPVFELMQRTGLIDPARPVHRTTDSDYWFRRIFQIVPPLYLRERTPAEVLVTRYVAVLSELLAGCDVPDATPAPDENWLSAACEMLAAHEGDSGMDPPAVAKKLGFSYESFRKKFRAAIGMAPGRYHLDSRIDRAAALLHQGRFTVKEIAAQLDFCDEFYFSRCFKRRFGQSPRAFRRRIRGNDR